MLGGGGVNPYSAEIFFYETKRTKFFCQYEIIINGLVSCFASFEYICYVSTAIINIVHSFSSGIDLRCQNLSL